MCSEAATGVEHVPARCFFPREHRVNLITVPSCSRHNNETSKDDEYARGIIVSALGNNKLAIDHRRDPVRRSYLHSPKLFQNTFQIQKKDAFFHDRDRIDNLMIKIAYALYYHSYRKIWESKPEPYYKQFLFDDGKSDIEVRLPNYETLPKYDIYEGGNKSVFKYHFLEGKINGKNNCLLRMVFYEGFEVLILPKIIPQ